MGSSSRAWTWPACQSARRLCAWRSATGSPIQLTRPLTIDHWRRLTGSRSVTSRRTTCQYGVAGLAFAGRRHALEAGDRWSRDQRIAVDPHEAIVELFLERGQRLLDQELALARAHGDVLEFGLQVDDLLERHEDHATALVDREVATPGVGRLDQRVDGVEVFGRQSVRARIRAASRRWPRTGFSR